MTLRLSQRHTRAMEAITGLLRGEMQPEGHHEGEWRQYMLTWRTNRAVSIGLIPLTIMPFAAGSLNPILDGALIGLTIIHTYIGFG